MYEHGQTRPKLPHTANRFPGYIVALTVPITRGMSGAQQNNAQPLA